MTIVVTYNNDGNTSDNKILISVNYDTPIWPDVIAGMLLAVLYAARPRQETPVDDSSGYIQIA